MDVRWPYSEEKVNPKLYYLILLNSSPCGLLPVFPWYAEL